MSSTDKIKEMEDAIRKLHKEITRLNFALRTAQDLNAGLERDKDNAWRLIQIVLGNSPGMRLQFSQAVLREYDPRRWKVVQTRDPVTEVLTLTLREK